MSLGLTFPQNPIDGQTISFSFTHTGGDAGNSVVTRTWSWDQGRGVWISNTSKTSTSNAQFELGTVSGNTKENGVARWEYSVFDTNFNGANFVVSGSFVNAKNLLEVMNTSTTAYGISVTGSHGITLAGFTGFSFKPVPNGTIVEMKYKNGGYFFSAPNPIDGAC